MSILVRRETLPQITLGALRVVTGLMFMQHGVQKHFGLLLPPDRPFTGAPAPMTQMWLAGTLEIFGGFLIAIGLFTRPIAFVLSGMMAVAYFQAHAPRAFWPAINGGELAVLYCFIFLALSALGGGRYSADALLRHREERVVVAEEAPEREPATEPWPAEEERRRGERVPRG